MTVFKKIDSDPVLEKKSEIQLVNPDKFRFLANLYWPIAEYGIDIDQWIDITQYTVWPSFYFSSQSLLTQPTESTKYFVDFYRGTMIPVNLGSLGGTVEGDFSPSFYITQSDVAFSQYYLYFIPTQERLFSTTWAHYAGSGGIDSSFNTVQTYPTKAIYNQIKMLYGQHGSEKFTLNDEEIDHFFYISLDQKSFSGSISPNSFVFPLMRVSQLEIQEDETQQTTYTFTDHLQSTLYSDTFGRYAYLVSGTLNAISSSEVFGAVYYDQKSFILNSEKLDDTVFYQQGGYNFLHTGSSVSGSTSWYLTGSQSSNSYMFGRFFRNSQYKNEFILIDESNPITPTDFEIKMESDSINSVYFLDVNYDEFNYTNNPSCFESEFYDIESNLYGKKFKYNSFKYEPVTYITSIGLYNDFGELIAIAKLPTPLKKDFSTRYSIKVVIKY